MYKTTLIDLFSLFFTKIYSSSEYFDFHNLLHLLYCDTLPINVAKRRFLGKRSIVLLGFQIICHKLADSKTREHLKNSQSPKVDQTNNHPLLQARKVAILSYLFDDSKGYKELYRSYRS